jgi:hypothetical protein
MIIRFCPFLAFLLFGRPLCTQHDGPRVPSVPGEPSCSLAGRPVSFHWAGAARPIAFLLRHLSDCSYSGLSLIYRLKPARAEFQSGTGRVFSCRYLARITTRRRRRCLAGIARRRVIR